MGIIRAFKKCNLMLTGMAWNLYNFLRFRKAGLFRSYTCEVYPFFVTVNPRIPLLF